MRRCARPGSMRRCARPGSVASKYESAGHTRRQGVAASRWNIRCFQRLGHNSNAQPLLKCSAITQVQQLVARCSNHSRVPRCAIHMCIHTSTHVHRHVYGRVYRHVALRCFSCLLSSLSTSISAFVCANELPPCQHSFVPTNYRPANTRCPNELPPCQHFGSSSDN